ncbi:phage tail protein [Pandoraea terrigena]|uniref:Phage tail fibre protein N-terminal domain-containing protein n=1 Tax=Pandoraea terrigena TaxID=2508292 RepID=A0A5E4YCM3_9BURK|nr:phage tail protein [Pandoraea terrigena]VVE46476.1 hypothetical protein PTE31013_04463 [Pandoraea terrigena]
MSATYFTTPTDLGNIKDANAKALGLPRRYTALAIGDGGGDNAPVPTPKPSQKALLGEWRRAALNTLEVDPKNPSQLIAEQVIPENEGGKWIREMGLYDEDGDLCYVCNAPPTYKPLLAEGSGKTQSVRMVIINASGVTVELKIDPSLILATREYADKSVTAAMKAHNDADDPHPQYAKKAKSLAGYGIEDAYKKAESDARFAKVTGDKDTPFSVKRAEDDTSAVPLGQLQAVTGTTGASSWRNRLINSAAQVAIQTTVPALSSTPQYGPVEMIAAWASGGAITAGTLIQDTVSPVGRTGHAVKLAGCTLTGAGVLSWRYRMEAAEALKLKNVTAAFQIAVRHDIGSPANYTVSLRKPTNTADDFTEITLIATSQVVSVASGVAVQLTPWQDGVALGDCAKGLEIEVQVTCGAVTAKNFWWTEWQLEEGTVATPVERRPIHIEMAACQRYACLIPMNMLYGYGWAGSAGAPTGTFGCDFPVDMRVMPTASAISWSLVQASTPVQISGSRRGIRYSMSGTVTQGEARATNSNDILLSARL